MLLGCSWRKEAACLVLCPPGSVPGGGSAIRPRRAVCESRPLSWQPWLRARKPCAVGRPVLLPRGLCWSLHSPSLFGATGLQPGFWCDTVVDEGHLARAGEFLER